MDWDLLDFAFFGALLAFVSAGYLFVTRKAASTTYKVAVGIALAASFILVWINGAVGIIGDEGNAANVMFIAVIATGLIGAIIARLRPLGMARALYATAFAQVLVAAIALIALSLIHI